MTSRKGVTTVAETRERELIVRHSGDSCFSIRVRGHEIVVDQPADAGGGDAGPTPTELFVASVAACAAYYGQTYLARRNLPDRVDVTARWRVVAKPDRVGSVSLQVDAPGLPPDRMEVFRRVLQGCLVHNTLKEGCDVAIDVRSDRRSGSVAAEG